MAAVAATLSFGLAAADDAADKTELRCGWFDNPSPANATLLDGDGEWIIGMQGGH